MELVTRTSKYSPQEEATYGKILQMLYLAEWRNIKIDLKQVTTNNVNQVYGRIQGILLCHYRKMLAGKRQEEDSFVFDQDFDSADGFTTQRLAEDCSPELFWREAMVDLEFDLRMLPTDPCHDNPFAEINRYHEK